MNPANPLELGLDRYVDLDSDDDFIGKSSLRKIRKQGISRKRRGFYISGNPVDPNQHPLPIKHDEDVVGVLSEMAWSDRLQKNIAIGMVSTAVAESVNLSVSLGTGDRELVATSLPFIDRRHSG